MTRPVIKGNKAEARYLKDRINVQSEIIKSQTRRDRALLKAFCDYYNENCSPSRNPEDIINTFLGGKGNEY